MDGSAEFKSVTENTRKLSLAPSSTLAPLEPFQMKVMKLPSPFFAIGCPYGNFLPLSSSSLADSSNNSDNSGSSNRSYSEQQQYAISNQLKLSASLEPVYMGETFRTCVSLSHNFRTPLSMIGVKIEMQKIEGPTVKNRVTLLDTTAEKDLFFFGVGECKDYVISHLLTEPGENCLVCSVMYPEDTPTGGLVRKTFKKFFRFQVFEPFMTKTQINHREDITIIEVSLTCAIPRPIFIEQVKLRGPSEISFLDLNQAACVTDDNEEAEQPSSISSSFLDELTGILMKGADSRNYLFRCDFVHGADKLACLVDVGVEVAWRSLGGEVGLLRSTVESKKIREQLKAVKEYELVLLEAPGSVKLEQPFSIKLQVRSNSMRSFELRLQLLKEKMVTILPCGLSNRSLGVFEPRGSKTVTVDLLPLGLGVHRISGFRLSCPKMSTHVDFDALHEVEVVT